MNNLFLRTRSHWAKYSAYELVDKDCITYITPAKNAKPSVYDPLKDAQTMVLDALNVDRLNFVLADENKLLRHCKKCMKVFISDNPKAKICELCINKQDAD